MGGGRGACSRHARRQRPLPLIRARSAEGRAASLEAAWVLSVQGLDLLHDARVGREPRVHVGGRLRVALERLQHLEPALVSHRPDRVEREAVAVLGAVEQKLAQLRLRDRAPRRVVLVRVRVRV